MAEKFRADPNRVEGAITSMEGLRDLISTMFAEFDRGLGNAGEILGHDKFGLEAGRQLYRQRIQLRDAGDALAAVFDAVPEMLRNQQKYVKKSQLGVIDAIHDSGSFHGPGSTDTGGKHGKY
jgi:hypothetical protein